MNTCRRCAIKTSHPCRRHIHAIMAHKTDVDTQCFALTVCKAAFDNASCNRTFAACDAFSNNLPAWWDVVKKFGLLLCSASCELLTTAGDQQQRTTLAGRVLLKQGRLREQDKASSAHGSSRRRRGSYRTEITATRPKSCVIQCPRFQN